MFRAKILPIVALVVLCGAIYFSFEWAVGAVVHNRKVVPVPDITSKTVGEALNLVAASHLGLTKDGEQFDKRYPAGTIVRQNPPAGMVVREGRIIRVTLSQGGETLFVPDLVGQPLRNAQTSLQNVGLGVGEVEHRPSLRFEKDVVMTTDPPAGAVVAKNALVNVILSEGSPGADVLLTPDFVGKTISEVRNWTSAHQVLLSVREENDITKSVGEIIMQAPTADSPLRTGETLTVVSNSSASNGQGPHIHYDVPAGPGDKDIKIVVIDEAGEHEVYRRAEAAGNRIDINVQAKGHARARIFSNGINVQEQELQ